MSLPKPKGIAARAGHWSARHRKTAIFGWLAFIVDRVRRSAARSARRRRPTPRRWTARAASADDRSYADAGFPKKTAEMVLVQSKTKTADDPAFKAAVADVAEASPSSRVVANVTSDAVVQGRPLGARPVRPQGRSGDRDRADPARHGRHQAASPRATRASPIEQFGDASMTKQLDDAAKAEEGNSQFMSFGMTLLILALTFGALVAAAVPVVLALTAVIGTTRRRSRWPARSFPIDDIAMPAIILIGLAVGVDYSLFYIRREREERAKGARQARGDRHRRRHLRPRRPDLRPDRHGRDGRHAAHRQHASSSHGHRHDPRDRRRRHRLADRAARRARRAWATSSRRAACRSSASASRRPASPACGAG